MSIAKYFVIFKLAAIHGLKNTKGLIGLSIFLITSLVIFSHIWKIAALKIGSAHLSPDKLLWYIAFNQCMIMSIPDVQDDMELDLRTGRLSYLLPRPISYLFSTLCEAFGVLCVNLAVLGVVAVAFTWTKSGSIPFSPSLLPIIFFLSLWAGTVTILFRMLIGLSAFWLNQVDPIFWIWEKLLFALGGLMLPLAIYPTWLQKIAHLTPFPSILGDRSALALDFSFAHVINLSIHLLFWSLFSISALFLLYRRGLRILNIEGG